MEEEQASFSFEMGVVVPKRVLLDQIFEGFDCVQLLVDQFHKLGLIVHTVPGLNDQFLKVYSLFPFFCITFTLCALFPLCHIITKMTYCT